MQELNSYLYKCSVGEVDENSTAPLVLAAKRVHFSNSDHEHMFGGKSNLMN